MSSLEESEELMDIEWSDPTPQEPVPRTKADAKGKERDFMDIVKALATQQKKGASSSKASYEKNISFLKCFLQQRSNPATPSVEQEQQGAEERSAVRKSRRRHSTKISDSQWASIHDMISSLRNTTAQSALQHERDSQDSNASGGEGQGHAAHQGNGERHAERDGGKVRGEGDGESGMDEEGEGEEDGFDDLPDGILEILTQFEAAHDSASNSSDSNQDSEPQLSPAAFSTPTLQKIVTPPPHPPPHQGKQRDILHPLPPSVTAAAAALALSTSVAVTVGGTAGGRSSTADITGAASSTAAAAAPAAAIARAAMPTTAMPSSNTTAGFVPFSSITLPSAATHTAVPMSRQENHPRQPALKRTASGSTVLSADSGKVNTSAPAPAHAPTLKRAASGAALACEEGGVGAACAPLPAEKKACTPEEIERKRQQAMILKKKKDAERKRELAKARQAQQQVQAHKPQLHHQPSSTSSATGRQGAVTSAGVPKR